MNTSKTDPLPSRIARAYWYDIVMWTKLGLSMFHRKIYEYDTPEIHGAVHCRDVEKRRSKNIPLIFQTENSKPRPTCIEIEYSCQMAFSMIFYMYGRDVRMR